MVGSLLSGAPLVDGANRESGSTVQHFLLCAAVKVRRVIVAVLGLYDILSVWTTIWSQQGSYFTACGSHAVHFGDMVH
jgi:hypothetical protein